MEQNQEFEDQQSSGEPFGSRANRWLILLAFVLVAVAGTAVGYGYHQQALVGQLTTRQSEANASMLDMRTQVETLTAKLNEVTAAQQAAAAAQAQNAAPAATPAARKSRAVADKRMKQMQTQLADQQKQLKDTRDELSKTRSDLEGNLSTTRDELNGSIARTHEELVTLAKRGERSYFEFDLLKSKQFSRTGPLSLSLRKADTKHMNYNLVMIVDDNQLTKKNVNLYEPIWIHRADDPQPVQVVINKIGKNQVHGYVSAPKFRQSELSTISYTQPAPGATTGQTSPAPSSNNSSEPPKNPEQQ